MYGGGGGGAGAFYRIFAIGIMVHARNRHRKHMLKLRRKHYEQQRKERAKRLAAKQAARAGGRSSPPGARDRVQPSVSPQQTQQPRPPSAPPRMRMVYTPAQPRDLHAGYWAARGGPPMDTREPQRAKLEYVTGSDGYARPTSYTRPGRPSVLPPDPNAAPAAPSAPAPAQTAPVVAAAGDGARFPDRSVGTALTHTTAPAAPAPQPQGYKGDYGELVKALTSNGWPKSDAIKKVKAAKLTADDDEPTAIVKCIQAVA